MSIESFYNDLVDFHKKYGLDYTGSMRPLARDVADFRMRCSIEEAEEIFGANESLLEVQTADECINALADLLDGFVDQLYFTLGTLYLHGIQPWQFDEAWKRVHEANMRKVRAQPDGSDSKRNHGCDVIKPEGWIPADLTDLV